jgi:hypothetical protein
MLSGQVLRGRQPALVISFVYHAVCHWNLPPGAAAIRAIGAVALGTMHASTVWFHIAENRRLCTTPDSGIIDFFRSKLVLQSARTRGMPTPAARFSFAWISCARTPRYADQQHDSSSILCGYAYGFDRNHNDYATYREAAVVEDEGRANRPRAGIKMYILSHVRSGVRLFQRSLLRLRFLLPYLSYAGPK